MSILKNFIKQIKSLFKKEEAVTYVAPCGTVAERLPLTIDIEEGKEAAKFNPITGKLYWPSDGSEADGPGIRDIPNYENKDGDELTVYNDVEYRKEKIKKENK